MIINAPMEHRMLYSQRYLSAGFRVCGSVGVNYVDCSACPAKAVYVRCPGHTSPHPGAACDHSHSNRYISKYQHPSDQHHLDLYRARSARNVGPNRFSHRAEPDNYSQQYRTHRITIPEWNCCREGLFPTKHSNQQLRRTSHRCITDPIEATAHGQYASVDYYI